LNLTGAKAKKHLEINPKACINCGICAKVCPGDAIVITDRHSISKGLCLTCLNCAYQCPKQAVYYK
jgi:formate hydrogenlyase subunit 6/NADH:ubiquinone oxidoreductase subunit I